MERGLPGELARLASRPRLLEGLRAPAERPLSRDANLRGLLSFDRVPPAFRPILEEARAIVAAKTSIEFVFPRFLCGVPPAFVGLHFTTEIPAEYDGGLYVEHAHCVQPIHLAHRPRDDRQTTIYLPERWLRLPERDAIRGVLHELAHAIDAELGYWLSVPETTPYSKTSPEEAFAEAFEILLEPPSGNWELCLAHPYFGPLRETVGFRA